MLIQRYFFSCGIFLHRFISRNDAGMIQILRAPIRFLCDSIQQSLIEQFLYYFFAGLYFYLQKMFLYEDMVDGAFGINFNSRMHVRNLWFN